MKIQVTADILGYNGSAQHTKHNYFKKETFFAPFISSIDNTVYQGENGFNCSLSQEQAREFGVDTVVCDFDIGPNGNRDFIGKDKLDIHPEKMNIVFNLPYVLYRNQLGEEFQVVFPNVEKAENFIEAVKLACEDYWANTRNLTEEV